MTSHQVISSTRHQYRSRHGSPRSTARRQTAARNQQHQQSSINDQVDSQSHSSATRQLRSDGPAYASSSAYHTQNPMNARQQPARLSYAHNDRALNHHLSTSAAAVSAVAAAASTLHAATTKGHQHQAYQSYQQMPPPQPQPRSSQRHAPRYAEDEVEERYTVTSRTTRRTQPLQTSSNHASLNTSSSSMHDALLIDTSQLDYGEDEFLQVMVDPNDNGLRLIPRHDSTNYRAPKSAVDHQSSSGNIASARSWYHQQESYSNSNATRSGQQDQRRAYHDEEEQMQDSHPAAGTRSDYQTQQPNSSNKHRSANKHQSSAAVAAAAYSTSAGHQRSSHYMCSVSASLSSPASPPAGRDADGLIQIRPGQWLLDRCQMKRSAAAKAIAVKLPTRHNLASSWQESDAWPPIKVVI